MRRLTKHDVNKLTTSELVALLPFELMSDGEAVALVSDVNILPEANHDVNRLQPSPDHTLKASHDVNKDEYVIVGGRRLKKVQ